MAEIDYDARIRALEDRPARPSPRALAMRRARIADAVTLISVDPDAYPELVTALTQTVANRAGWADPASIRPGLYDDLVEQTAAPSTEAVFEALREALGEASAYRLVAVE